MPGFVRIRSFFVTAFLLAAWGASLLAQTAVNRVAEPIDESQIVIFAGNAHPLARAEFDRGPVDAETRLDRMLLVLMPSPAQQAELDVLVEVQHDPRSPLYHRWLTPAEFGARFGASRQNLARVTAWLQGHGFTVDEIPAGNRLIVFSGTAGQVAETFHTEIHRYRVDGVEHLANAGNPRIPAALAGVVGGVVSLHDFRRRSEIAARRALPGALPLYSSGSMHYLFPADFATIYDLNAPYGAGTTGAGTSIAIAGRSNVNLSDVTAFRSAAGLTENNPAVILAGADPGLVAGDQDEATLDVEWAGAVAPAAAVKLVVGESTATTDGVDLSAQYIVNHAAAPVVSVSYGSCEQEMGTVELAFYNSLWQQAASQGISVFVASGDAGAAGCNVGSDSYGSGAAVNGLCSPPYSTCVGGTEFNEGSNSAEYWSQMNSPTYGSALGYIPEEAWNESASNGGSGLWATGGGVSTVYPQPAWQAGVNGSSGGMRTVPDVAMTTAGHDGYVTCENGSFWVFSGTSAAAPSFAAVMALAVESQDGIGQGNANPELYSLATAQRSPFHTTPSGNNSVPGVTGFTASGALYNLATGLGSVDAAVLVGDWGVGGGAGADFALAASATSGSVPVGAAATFTIHVVESGAGKNAVTLTAQAPAGVSVSFSPSTVLPGAAAAVTVTVGPAASAGAQSVILSGADSSGTQELTYELTVTDPPMLALKAASNTVALAEGGSSVVSFWVATGGPFSGDIGLTVSGLPAGITARWSANPIVPAASVSTNKVKLTLTAAAGAVTEPATIVAAASGDGLQSVQSVTVMVQPRQACCCRNLRLAAHCGPPVRMPLQ
jgi:hypothetical protein